MSARSRTSPKMLAARMERAKAEGKPMDLDYDEVTGVIDVALEKSREITDAGIAKAREAIQKLDPARKTTSPA